MSVCGLLSVMEKNGAQKPYSITVYAADNKRILMPLQIMRESNILYEQYCKKIKDKEEKLSLQAPLHHADLSFFIDVCQHIEEKGEEYYYALPEDKKKASFKSAIALKDVQATIDMLNGYYLPPDIVQYISTMVFSPKESKESLRYCKIKAYLESQKYYHVPSLKSAQEKITIDQLTFVYKGDGRCYKVPLCVMENDTAMWAGKSLEDYSIKVADNIYRFSRVRGDKHALTQNKQNTTEVLYNIPGYVRFVFSNDGQWFVTGSYIFPFNITFYPLSRKGQKAVKYPFKNEVNVFKFNDQSTLLAIGFSNNDDNEILLLTMPQEGEMLSEVPVYKPLKNNQKGVWALQFSGDNQRLLSCSEKNITLWDISNYDNIRVVKEIVLNEHILKIRMSEFSNRIMVIADHQYVIYDSATGELVNSKHRMSENIGTGLYDVVLSNDGKFFLTITQNDDWQQAYFKVWDAQTGQEIARLHPQYQNSNALGFTPDLQYIIDTNVDQWASINRTRLYTDQDAKDIAYVANYKPINLCDAYAVWRGCKAAEYGDTYLDGIQADEIKKIIAVSIVKK